MAAVAVLASSSASANRIEKEFWRTEDRYGTGREGGVGVPHAVVGEGPVRVGFFRLLRPVRYGGSGESIELCVPVLAGPDHRAELFEAVRRIDRWTSDAGVRDRLLWVDEPAELGAFLRDGG